MTYISFKSHVSKLPPVPLIPAHERPDGVVNSVSNMPGMLNVFGGIVEARSSFQIARTTEDKEIKTNSILRVASAPFMVINGAALITSTVTNTALDSGLYAFATTGVVAGIVLCIFEFVIETLAFVKSYFFYNETLTPLIDLVEKMHTMTLPKQEKAFARIEKELLAKKSVWAASLGTDQAEKLTAQLENMLQKIKAKLGEIGGLRELEATVHTTALLLLHAKHFQLSPEEKEAIRAKIKSEATSPHSAWAMYKTKQLYDAAMKQKGKTLIRRLHPWAASEVSHTILPALKKLTSGNVSACREGLEEARRISFLCKMQSQKKMVIHALGIVGLTAFIASSIFTFGAAPLAAVTATYVIGMTLISARYLAYKGLLKSKSWKMNWANVPPSWSKYIASFFTKTSAPSHAQPCRLT